MISCLNRIEWQFLARLILSETAASALRYSMQCCFESSLRPQHRAKSTQLLVDFNVLISKALHPLHPII